MRKHILLLSITFIGMMGCKISKNSQANSIEKIILEDVVVSPQTEKEKPSYHPMETRIVDLLHTQLFLSFDYQKQWAYGTAVLTLKPYCQTLASFKLDAQGFGLNQVARIKGKDTLNLSYSYDSVQLEIKLDKDLLLSDTLKLLVQYIAKPNEIKTKGGKAITDSRGLYFINPLGTDPNKPRQIWSQGETQYNSCWFPTVDAPNEKHTQDIYLTIDSTDVSLSNGLLMGSKKEKNGQHTDHWQQLKPHAPYLTMIAIGDFRITKEQWRGKEVSYYLEPQFAPYAKTIFGKTPQMLETYSRITGVDYPWDKFSQVVCRDFVSGAMENTTAVVHYEMVQHTDREHLDNPMEDIIAHELFHHWFGDLVTSRSWSNIPLNESFATYGEYLYNEATYGKLFADAVFAKNWDAYLMSKKKHDVSPHRLVYENPDEVFDVVSYQKGSWILHCLRAEIGDDAFFKGIKNYLVNNAYSTTDFADLRHAMELASGKDLNLFFNQWFEGTGHPIVSVNSYLESTTRQWKVEIKQLQGANYGMFYLKTQLSSVWKLNDELSLVQTKPIDLGSAYEMFTLEPPVGMEGAELVSYWLDPNGNLPAILLEKKSPEAWLLQLKMASSYQGKLRAMRRIIDLPEAPVNITKEAIQYFLNNSETAYQILGLKILEKAEALYDNFEPDVKKICIEGGTPKLREEAFYVLSIKAKYEISKPLFLKGLEDSSYEVMATCLEVLNSYEPSLALAKCAELEVHKTGSVQKVIASIYASEAQENKNAYYLSILGKYGYTRSSILRIYGQYLQRQNAQVLAEGITILSNYYALNSDRDKARLMQNVLINLEEKSAEKTFFQSKQFQDFRTKVDLDFLDY
ncbi:MAG: M1 family metallopeptidase [Bacteroidia bacterium]|nr:M1 family metallopeptidase [Bacteroidia bacterium]MCF8447002.1 M1 family metallopeptidase [Bacteroidia bacterium]